MDRFAQVPLHPFWIIRSPNLSSLFPAKIGCERRTQSTSKSLSVGLLPLFVRMPFRTTVMAAEYDDGCTSPLSMESTEAHLHHHEQQHGTESFSPTHSAVSLDNGVTVLDAYHMHLAGDDAFDENDDGSATFDDTDRDATPAVADAIALPEFPGFGTCAYDIAAATARLPSWQAPSMLQPLGLDFNGINEEDGVNSSRTTQFVYVNPTTALVVAPDTHISQRCPTNNINVVVVAQQHQVVLSGSSSLCIGNLSTVLSVSDVEQHMETEEYARKALLALTQQRRNGGLSDENSSSGALLQRVKHKKGMMSKCNRCDDDDDHPLGVRYANDDKDSTDGASGSSLKAKQVDSMCSSSSLPP